MFFLGDEEAYQQKPPTTLEEFKLFLKIRSDFSSKKLESCLICADSVADGKVGTRLCSCTPYRCDGFHFPSLKFN